MTQYRQQNLTNYQPTLGEMADQFQERARAEAKVSQPKPVTSRVVDLANQVYNNSAAGAEEYYGYGGGDGDGDDYDGDDNDGGFDGDDDPALISAGNESTGRWTRPEHELFLQALKKYGKVSNRLHPTSSILRCEELSMLSTSSLLVAFPLLRSGRKLRVW
jgi:hypothetical protein